MTVTNIAPNRFLRKSDLDLVIFKTLKKEIEHIYCDIFRGKPHVYGAKNKKLVKMHWSREWEYPWAIIYSDVKKGDRILDCGCGGSPLLPFFAYHDVECYGVDKNYGKKLKSYSKIKLMIFRTSPLATLRDFYVDPSVVVGKNITISNDDMTNLHFEDESFDKIFCISVIEHLSVAEAKKSIEEMVRVVKPGGKILLTIDHDGKHVNPELQGKYQEIISWSNLDICGDTDFTIPKSDEIHGTYNVLGVILRKPIGSHR